MTLLFSRNNLSLLCSVGGLEGIRMKFGLEGRLWMIWEEFGEGNEYDQNTVYDERNMPTYFLRYGFSVVLAVLGVSLSVD